MSFDDDDLSDVDSSTEEDEEKEKPKSKKKKTPSKKSSTSKKSSSSSNSKKKEKSGNTSTDDEADLGSDSENNEKEKESKPKSSKKSSSSTSKKKDKEKDKEKDKKDKDKDKKDKDKDDGGDKKKSKKKKESKATSSAAAAASSDDDDEKLASSSKPKSSKKKSKSVTKKDKDKEKDKEKEKDKDKSSSSKSKKKTSVSSGGGPHMYQLLTEIASKIQQIKTETTNNNNNNNTNTKTLLDKAMLSKTVMDMNSIDPVLYAGIPVWKITSSGNWEQRYLTLSYNHQVFLITHKPVKLSEKDNVAQVASKLSIPLWTPSKGLSLGHNGTSGGGASYVRYVDIADLDGWNVGLIGTQTLELSRQKTISKANKTLDESIKEIVSIYHSGQRSLDLIITDTNHRTAVITALRKVYDTYHQIYPWIGNDALLLRYIWYDVDADTNQLISKKEFSQICTRINFYVKNSSKLFDDFVKTSAKNKKELTYRECTRLLESMKPKQPSAIIWEQLFGGGSGGSDDNDKNVVVESISPEQLLEKFLKKTQCETNVDLKDAKALMTCVNTMELENDYGPSAEEEENDNEEKKQDNNESSSSSSSSLKMTLKQFTSYLHSSWNDAYDPEKQKLVGALDAPLSHYWINTSHNTYLTGDQLQSKSSVEAYVRAMLRGCKCLELDCWDGPQLQDVFYIPVVYHGHTLTSKIEFRHIILAVNNYLEEVNPNSYPIILSLENHCSHPFQSAMANCMTDIFGDKLFVPTPEQVKGDQPLPSPESLRGKVVIKGKRPPEKDDVPGEETKEGDDDDEEEEDNEDSYDEAINEATKKNESGGSNASPKGGEGEATTTPKKPPKFDPNLAKLTLFHGTKFKSFEASIEQDHSHMHSIGETKITKVIAKKPNNAKLWRRYNIDHMTRTYPAGARVDSSNYNPVLAWAMGCQLVALNFQTHDTPLILNDGRFRQNGGCGYVKKPDSMLNKKKDGGASMKTIKIQVLGGNCLPKPKGAKKGETIDPYVIVELHDVRLSDDGEKEEHVETIHKTEYIDDNGFCPVWDEENKKKEEENNNGGGGGKEFLIHNTDVAMFHFKMVDKDVLADDRIASAAIPVSCLRQGYRSIQLYDHHNSRTGAFRYATLLVKITKL